MLLIQNFKRDKMGVGKGGKEDILFDESKIGAYKPYSKKKWCHFCF